MIEHHVAPAASIAQRHEGDFYGGGGHLDFEAGEICLPLSRGLAERHILNLEEGENRQLVPDKTFSHQPVASIAGVTIIPELQDQHGQGQGQQQ